MHIPANFRFWVRLAAVEVRRLLELLLLVAVAEGRWNDGHDEEEVHSLVAPSSPHSL